MSNKELVSVVAKFTVIIWGECEPQDVVTLASERAFTATERRFKKSMASVFCEDTFSRLGREEKEKVAGYDFIITVIIWGECEPQDVVTLASERAFIATERRFKKSTDGFFNKSLNSCVVF